MSDRAHLSAPSALIAVKAKRPWAPSFIPVQIAPNAYVAELIEAVMGKLKMAEPPDTVALVMAETGVALDSTRSLADAGVLDQTCVHVVVTSPPAAGAAGESYSRRTAPTCQRVGKKLPEVQMGRRCLCHTPSNPTRSTTFRPALCAGAGDAGARGGPRGDYGIALERLEGLLRRTLSPSEKEAFARPELKSDREDLAQNVPLSKDALQRLVIRLKTVVTTRKRLQIATATGYYFDGQLSSSEGRARPCILYRVVTPSGRIGVAKVYFSDEATSAQKEWELSRALAPHEALESREGAVGVAHGAGADTAGVSTRQSPAPRRLSTAHPLVLYEARLELDDDRVALCMPLYACTLQDLLREAHGSHALPASFLLRVADAVEAALSLLHGQGFAHCDVKPDNIMLRESGEPVLIDLGSATQFGHEIKEGAPQPFILDCDTTSATAQLDRVCLATSLWAAVHRGVDPSNRTRLGLLGLCQAEASAAADDARAVLDRIASLLRS